MRAIGITCCAAAALLLCGSTAVLADPQQSAVYSISPIAQNVNLPQNAPQAHYVVTLSNSSDTAQTFKLSVLDFGALNESGGVAFLGTSSSQFAQQFGLASWVTLDRSEVSVPGGASTDIGVTINNSASLRPGGHYAAVLATAQTAPGGAASSPRVGVVEVLSSLLLLIKGGAPPPDLRLISQHVDRQGLSLPSTVTQRFYDAGDEHVVPRGVITVTDPLGHLVERAVINENSGVILPQTYRQYSASLMQLTSAWTPGIYHVQAAYRNDGTQSTKTYVSSFWYIPKSYLLAAVFIVLLVTAGIAYWYLHKRTKLKAKR